jgi:hypothetical protein
VAGAQDSRYDAAVINRKETTMDVVLHDTHHRVSTRCHLLSVGDVVMYFTKEAWDSDLPPDENPRYSGHATIDDYELWTVEAIDKKARTMRLRRDDVVEYSSWTSRQNVVTALEEGPDPLYASTEELCDQGWENAKRSWGITA